jgi:hypothetical protein
MRCVLRPAVAKAREELRCPDELVLVAAFLSR